MAMPTLAAGHIPTAAELKQITDRIDLLSAPPYAQLRQTGAQSFGSGAFTAVTFDAEDFDSYGGHSTVTNTSRYTSQLSGIYLISGKIGWAAHATGRRASRWAKNGTEINGSQIAIIATSASDIGHPAATMLVSLTAGDYIELLGFQESGGNLSTVVSGAQQPTMVVRWIAEG